MSEMDRIRKDAEIETLRTLLEKERRLRKKLERENQALRRQVIDEMVTTAQLTDVIEEQGRAR